MNFNISTLQIMLKMKRFGVELKRTPVKGVINENIKSENESLYTKNSISLQKNSDCGDDGSSNYEYNHNHNYNSVYDIYASNNLSSHMSNYTTNNSQPLSNNIDTDSMDYNENKIRCNLCNVVNDNTNFIILSCCNDICHIKCLINKFNIFNDNTETEYKEFNENSITPDFLIGLQCLKCSNSLNYEDIFNLYSKYILNNKKYMVEYDKKILSLKDQKKKIENEIKCLNEYITKLQNEKNISQIIMKKTFQLMSSS